MSLTSTFPTGPVTLSQNARTVLGKRYLVKDKTGSPTESPEDLFWRVATVVAEADARYGATEGAVQAVAEGFDQPLNQPGSLAHPPFSLWKQLRFVRTQGQPILKGMKTLLLLISR